MPVTNATGFTVGDRIGIGSGDDYEPATVTAVGKAATQTTLSADAAEGATNIKVAADANMTVGDTLTVDTGESKETVTVANVGTTGANGTGVDLAAPLRLAHASGVDVSDPGTGISFSPPTRHPHTSGEPVQALGGGLTLDKPLKAHPIGAAVVNPLVTTAGYQGTPAPDQWFGSALSTSAGSIALLDERGGVVVDAVVYGSQQSSSSGNGTIATPELAVMEADQGQGGCIAVVPGAAGRRGPEQRPLARRHRRRQPLPRLRHVQRAHTGRAQLQVARSVPRLLWCPRFPAGTTGVRRGGRVFSTGAARAR